MADELRVLFEAFEVESLSRTSPPGAPAVQRTVRRRYATRAVAFAVAALALLLVAVWSPLRASQPQPIGPTPSAPAPTTTDSPASPTPGASAAPSGVAGAPSPTRPECDPKSNAYVGIDLGGPAPDQYALTPSMFATCPGLKVWLALATYVGAGANAGTLTRTASTSTTLTAANPSATLSPQFPPASCESVIIATLVGYSGPPTVPASIPNYVPSLVSTGSTEDLRYYLVERGVILKNASWQAPTC
jgi:hypothetical protein